MFKNGPPFFSKCQSTFHKIVLFLILRLIQLHLIFRPATLVDFQRPTAEQIFNIIILKARLYEVSSPLKNVREDTINTIKNHKLESITSDDNGAYNKSNGNKNIFMSELRRINCLLQLFMKKMGNIS